MSNNCLDHNVPGYSGNYDPGPSFSDLPGTSYHYDLEPTVHTPDPVPFVSSYGMVNATNSLQDVEMFRATLFNLKTEPEEDREIRSKQTTSDFLRRCREPDECDVIDVPPGKEIPNECDVISVPPREIILDDEPMPVIKSEPHEVLIYIYRGVRPSPEILHLYMDMYNPRANRGNSIVSQQSREQEEMYEIVEELQPEELQPEELQPVEIFLQQSEEPEEMDEINIPQVEQPEQPEDMFIQQSEEPEEMDEINIPQVEQPEDMFIQQSEEPEEMYEIYIPLEELQPEETFSQQSGEPEEMDEINTPLVELQPKETSETEDLSLNVETDPLEYPPEINTESTETRSPIDTTTNPRPLNEEMEPLEYQTEINTESTETHSPIDITINSQLLNEETEPLEYPPEIYTESTETLSPINTATNSRASNLDNGRTNIIEKPTKRTRKKKEVIITPTRVSTRIKKPRIMYNV